MRKCVDRRLAAFAVSQPQIRLTIKLGSEDFKYDHHDDEYNDVNDHDGDDDDECFDDQYGDDADDGDDDAIKLGRGFILQEFKISMMMMINMMMALVVVMPSFVFGSSDHWFLNSAIKHSVTSDKQSRSAITGDK